MLPNTWHCMCAETRAPLFCRPPTQLSLPLGPSPCRVHVVLVPDSRRNRRTCVVSSARREDAQPSSPSEHSLGHESNPRDVARQTRRKAESTRKHPQDPHRSRSRQQLLPPQTPLHHARPPASSSPGGLDPRPSGRPNTLQQQQQPASTPPLTPIDARPAASTADPPQPLATASQQPDHPPPPPPLRLWPSFLARVEEPSSVASSLGYAAATAAAAVTAAASFQHLLPRASTPASHPAGPGPLAGAQQQPWTRQGLPSSPGGRDVGSPVAQPPLPGYSTPSDLGPGPASDHVAAGFPLAATDGADAHAAAEAMGSGGLAQLVEGARAGQDPAAAAEKLQAFVLQYRGRYGPGVAARIDATATRLQAFADAQQQGGGGDGDAAVQVLEGQYGGPGPLELAVVSAVPGSPPGPQYHNYVMDGVLGALQGVQQLLQLPSGAPAPGGMMQPETSGGGAGPAAGQGRQLESAADTLRGLADQLSETQRLYRVPDPEERGSLSTLSTQLATIADKLAASGPLLPGVDAGGDPGGIQQQVPSGWGPGADGGAADPLLALLDGLYQAVVQQRGLRDFLLGVKRLGDSIVTSMDGGWHSVPPAARLVAYAAALAGACFLLRNRLPELLGPGSEGSRSSAAGNVPSGRARATAQGRGEDSNPALQERSVASSSSPPPPSHAGGGRAVIRGPSDGRTPQAGRGQDPWTMSAAAGAAAPAAGRHGPAGGSSGGGGGGIRMVSLPREVGVGHARGGVQAAWDALRLPSASPGGKGNGHAAAGPVSGAGERVQPASGASSPSSSSSFSSRWQVEEQRVLALKQQVSWATMALGPVMAVVPGGEAVRRELDGVLGALEGMDPSRDPQASKDGTPDSALLGTWTLSYASNGPAPAAEASSPTQPNLLAQLLQLADNIPGLGMDAITHKLSRSSSPPHAVTMENSTVFRFGPLGSWRVSVQGGWQDSGAGTAELDFHTFCLRPVAFLGLPVADLPEVRVPIPEVLVGRSTWSTTYLDADMRINRSDAGGIFVFRRPEAVEGAAWSQGQRLQHAPSTPASSPYPDSPVV